MCRYLMANDLIYNQMNTLYNKITMFFVWLQLPLSLPSYLANIDHMMIIFLSSPLLVKK